MISTATLDRILRFPYVHQDGIHDNLLPCYMHRHHSSRFYDDPIAKRALYARGSYHLVPSYPSQQHPSGQLGSSTSRKMGLLLKAAEPKPLRIKQ
jgi:hypothetical protein